MNRKAILAIPLIVVVIGVWFVLSQTNNNPSFTISPATGIYAFSNNNQELATSFLKTDDSNHLYTLHDESMKTSLDFYLDPDQFPPVPVNSRTSQLSQKNRLVLYDILPDTDMTYAITDHGVKEDIVLKSKEALNSASSYSFLVKTIGLTPQKNTDGTLLPIFASATNQHAESFQLVPPYMTDAKNQTSYAVSLVVSPTDEPNTYRLTLIPDIDWLTDSNRVYPVHIDPTVVKGATPTGHWKFDEGYGTTAQDSSASNYDATISGPTVQPVDQCISGNCLFFDGTNDVVNINNASLDNFGDYGASTGQTLAAWVRTGSLTDQTVIGIGSSSTNTPLMALTITSAGNVRFQYRTDNSAELGSGVYDTSGINVIDNKWHHLALRRSGSTFEIYVDGSLQKTGTDASSFNTLTATTGKS